MTLVFTASRLSRGHPRGRAQAANPWFSESAKLQEFGQDWFGKGSREKNAGIKKDRRCWEEGVRADKSPLRFRPGWSMNGCGSRDHNGNPIGDLMRFEARDGSIPEMCQAQAVGTLQPEGPFSRARLSFGGRSTPTLYRPFHAATGGGFHGLYDLALPGATTR